VNENLQQFHDDAEQLAKASGYDGIRLGVVWSRTAPMTVIALSAVLVRKAATPPLLEPLDTSLVSARQWLGSMEELGALLTSIDSGEIGQPFSEQARLSTSIHLTTSGQSIGWSETHRSHGEFGLGLYTEGRGAEIAQLTGPGAKNVDSEVAVQSDYAYASLHRLIRAFTGLKREENRRAVFLLSAPWPVTSMTAQREASRLRVEVDGLPGVDTSRFILNIEGMKQDQRLDAKMIRWMPGPESASGTCTYTSVFEVTDKDPLFVNLYISRTPSISLRTEIQRDQGVRIAIVSQGPAAGISLENPEDTRLTAFRVQSFRLLRSAELRLDPPLSVIVGPNQSGKSSLLDALQLLSEAARGELANGLVQRRSGIRTIQSRGATEPLRLEAELRTASGHALRFRLQLGAVGAYDFAVEQEELAEYVQGSWMPVLSRVATQAKLSGTPVPVSNEREALISQLGGILNPLVHQARASLAAIAVYPYFRTGASWADPESVPMRRPVRLEPGARLERTGNNLAAALFSLREERPEDWQDFVNIVRLAFPSLKDLRLPPVGRGTVQLFWDEVNGGQFDASELSDGTLHFLASLCALFQPGSALIALDEPEAHLHPDALMRLMGAARSLSERHPILFTTQSDALIGLLDDAPECVVVARREEQEARLIRPEADQLREWLKSFSLREMRRELEGWDSTP
jgi:predicted ATPase